jgi:hypothetical protein
MGHVGLVGWNPTLRAVSKHVRRGVATGRFADEAPFAVEPTGGPRPTSGGRANAGSKHFMAQLLPPNFCWHPLQTRPPRRRSDHAIGLSNQWRNQWQTRRRIRALIPGKKQDAD